MSSSTGNECSVCLDTYTSSLRKKIVCKSCDYAVCRSCICMYFMNTNKEFHCMNCNVAWSYEFMVNSVGRSYLNTKYSKARSSYLFDVELSKIPETMAIVERRKEQDKLIKLRDILYKKIDNYDATMSNLEYKCWGTKWYNLDIETLISNHKEYNTVKEQKETLRNQIDDLNIRINNKPKHKTNNFIIPCSKEDCRGFLNKKYTCGVCDTSYCSKCHIKKADDHECKDDDVKTANYILKQTKPCPKCGTRISKVDGCDQMWCVHCHTTFSWQTGRAEHGGPIHNPHFMDFVRNGGGGGGGGEGQALHECNGNLPYQQTLIRFIRNNATDEFTLNCSLELVRSYYDIEQKMNRIEELVTKYSDHTDKRVDYILGNIDKESFTKYINRCDRALNRETENRYIYDLLLTVMRETILGIYNSHDDFDNVVKESWAKICELIEYCDKEFERLGSVFNVIPCHTYIEMDGIEPTIVLKKKRTS